MSNESWAYNLKFTAKANAQLERLAHDLNPNELDRLRDALEQLQRNPFPTAPLTPGTIKRIRHFWRYKISYSYRLAYEVEGQTVIVFKVGHRKDFYRDL